MGMTGEVYKQRGKKWRMLREKMASRGAPEYWHGPLAR
jgi:hypothetical protein